jgi:hypothetical protein
LFNVAIAMFLINLITTTEFQSTRKSTSHHRHHHKSKEMPSSSVPVEDADLAKGWNIYYLQVMCNNQSLCVINKFLFQQSNFH